MSLYLALLTYRTTPLQNGLSPSELIMGRKLRTPLPMMPAKLDQKVPKAALEEAEEREITGRNKPRPLMRNIDQLYSHNFVKEIMSGSEIKNVMVSLWRKLPVHART